MIYQPYPFNWFDARDMNVALAHIHLREQLPGLAFAAVIGAIAEGVLMYRAKRVMVNCANNEYLNLRTDWRKGKLGSTVVCAAYNTYVALDNELHQDGLRLLGPNYQRRILEISIGKF